MREVQSQQKEAQRCERQGDCTQRPCEPCGGAVAYPTDSSTLFPCPFCHNTTLQHYPLPSVTTNVTKIALSESGKTASPEILLRNEAMYACVVETGRGFFEGACAPSNATAHFCDPPPLRNAKRPEPWQWGSGQKRIMRRVIVNGDLAWGRGKPHASGARAALASHPCVGVSLGIQRGSCFSGLRWARMKQSCH